MSALRLIKRLIRAGLLAAGAAGFYTWVLRPWLMRLGAQPDELDRGLPGDELVPDPHWSITQAVTIHAGPEKIWPWLVQMGYGRGGFYSYGWGDRGSGILPEYQALAVRDTIALQPGWAGLSVTQVDPDRALVLESCLDLVSLRSFDRYDAEHARGSLSWTWALEPLGEDRTRLITRVRTDLNPQDSPFLDRLVGEVLKPGSAVAGWGMLQGIKRRAESAEWSIEDE